MPYGELLVYQTLTDYNERFKFTGKERDEERVITNRTKNSTKIG